MLGSRMGLEITLIVLISAVMHPFWNLLIKGNPDPQLGYLFLSAIMAASGLVHGLLVGANFSAALTVLPMIAVSVIGQLLYGTCLTATLARGDLSVYYPIIRSSPVFIVVAGVLVFGKTYPALVLLGIALAVGGGILLLYRRGSHFLEDKRALAFALIAMCGTGIYSMADAGVMAVIEPPVLVFIVDSSVAMVYALLWYRRKEKSPYSGKSPRSLSLTQILLPGLLAYASYYLILLAYQLGGEVAAVTSMRQASIPVSVALGGLFLREGAMLRRFFAAAVLASGIVVIALNG